jgi:hypothetical protein
MSESYAPALPEGFHEELWVMAKGYNERIYLGWKPDITSFGRIGAWSPEHNSGTRISKGDVWDASDQSEVWIDAYLIGSQPSFEHMFGVDARNAPDFSSKFERWEKQCKEYRCTGIWRGGEWFIPRPLEIDALLRITCTCGEEMRFGFGRAENGRCPNFNLEVSGPS